MMHELMPTDEMNLEEFMEYLDGSLSRGGWLHGWKYRWWISAPAHTLKHTGWKISPNYPYTHMVLECDYTVLMIGMEVFSAISPLYRFNMERGAFEGTFTIRQIFEHLI